MCSLPLRRAQAAHGVSVRVVPFRRASGRGSEGHTSGRLLPRLLGRRRGDGCRRAARHRGPDPARRRTGAWGDLCRRPRARGRLLRRLGPEVDVRAGGEWSPLCPARPPGRARAALPGPLNGGRSPRPARFSARRERPRGSTTAFRARCAAPGRSLRWASSPGAGWAWVHEHASAGAELLAELLSSRGHVVAPRGRSTLVSWKSDDADGDVARLAAQGIIVRSIPSAGLVRASVGAWTSEEEIHRLAELCAGSRSCRGAPLLDQFGCGPVLCQRVGLPGP